MYFYLINKDHQITRTSVASDLNRQKYADRVVGADEFSIEGELYRVSTVFLCIDHNMECNENPILFETMIFIRNELGDNIDAMDYQTRCHTWDGAVQMHKVAIEYLKNLKDIRT